METEVMAGSNMMTDVMWTTDITTPAYEYPVRFSALLILSVMTILIITSNIIVLAVYTFTNTLRIPMSIHMKSLAIADLWVGVNCALNIPFTLNNGQWPFGLPLCKLTTYLLVLTVGVSVSSLTVISVDRYIAICHPMKYRNIVSKNRTRLVVVVVWVFNCILYLPSNFDWFRGNPMLHATDCTLHYRYNISLSFFVIAITIIPNFVVSFVSYTMIVKALKTRNIWLRKTTEHGRDPRGDSAKARRKEQDKLMVKVGMAILSAFYITWLPYLIFGTIRQLGLGNPSQAVINLSLYLGISNSFLNCLIYSIANKAFRSSVWELLKRLCCCWRRKVSLSGSGTTRTAKASSSQSNSESIKVSQQL